MEWSIRKWIKSNQVKNDSEWINYWCLKTRPNESQAKNYPVGEGYRPAERGICFAKSNCWFVKWEK